MRPLRRALGGASIPTSSMADIAFLLVIFFMVTAVFSATKGLEMRLPPLDDDAAPRPEPAVVVHITADAVLVDCRPTPPDSLLASLQPILRRNPAKPVVLYTDPGAEYRRMVEVYDELAGPRGGGIVPATNLQVPTRRDLEEYTELFGQDPFALACP